MKRATPAPRALNPPLPLAKSSGVHGQNSIPSSRAKKARRISEGASGSNGVPGKHLPHVAFELNNRMYELRHYTDPEGQDLFAHRLDHLQDRAAQARVAARLLRLQNGNVGDCKPVG